jgi:hypothetical protein
MFNLKTALPRRTFLRGMGATLALPLLDAMIPAGVAQSKTAAAGARRFGTLYSPQGFILEQWTPLGAGKGFDFSRILKPLEPMREYVNVVSNTSNGAPRAGGHAIAPAMMFTGVRTPKRTEGADIFAGMTIDQAIAAQIGQDTPFPSLEVATEDFTTSVGACEIGFSCTYLNTVSWKRPTEPLPMEINPRVLFERMFGGAGTPQEREARLRARRSILDAVTQQATRLQKGLGGSDRTRLVSYMDNIREVERRIEKAEQRSAVTAEVPDAPQGVPESFTEHAALMFDLLHLAFQADITRVFSFMLARELSQRTYPEIGVPDIHHALSHHQHEPEKVEKYARTNMLHLKVFADFVQKLKETPDGDGSLLDHSTLVYGSGMSDGNVHAYDPLPIAIVGHASGRLTGDRHIMAPEHTPVGNLYVTLAQLHGVDVETFGDSNGALAL